MDKDRWKKSGIGMVKRENWEEKKSEDETLAGEFQERKGARQCCV